MGRLEFRLGAEESVDPAAAAPPPELEDGAFEFIGVELSLTDPTQLLMMMITQKNHPKRRWIKTVEDDEVYAIKIFKTHTPTQIYIEREVGLASQSAFDFER